jgi:phosphoadenosine phosphosulfate reductase
MPARRDAFDPAAVAAELEARSAEDVLAWAIETFHPSLYFACSFQKTTSVIVHMAQQIDPATRFFYLDTDLLFAETDRVRDALGRRYGLWFERVHGPSLGDQARRYGDDLWASEPDLCCGIRKVEPMRCALTNVDCWVSGIRRVDSETRARTAKFGWDVRFGLWKVNPLADWTDDDVWAYIRANEIPYNRLHDAGYPSIGCTPCTQPAIRESESRSGRWSGTGKVECGLHG